MPIQISLLDALDKDLDGLLPAEFTAMCKMCEADPEDEAPKRILADWLAEHEEADLEFGVRWLVARHITPFRHRARYGDSNTWGFARWYDPGNSSHKLPDEFRYGLGELNFSADSLFGSIAKFTKKLVEHRAKKQAELDAEFSIETQPLPEPEAKPEAQPATEAKQGEPVAAEAVAF